MSELETEVIPLINEMSLGSTQIIPVAQTLLARWASKTVMMYGQYRPETNGFTSAAYRIVYETQQPPTGMDIHLGWCSQAMTVLWTDGLRIGAHGTPIESILSSEPALASGFVGLEGLCLFVNWVSPEIDLPLNARSQLSGAALDSSRKIHRIWPTSTTLAWPPKEMSERQVRRAMGSQSRAVQRLLTLSPEVITSSENQG
ncbi:MAG: hypothetical protein L0G99_16815 [Propionibacteriales bacterium]|nr:hypothetical protein [Propionibacteriales bacterium]